MNDNTLTTKAHTCPKCGKVFDKPQGLRCHLMRMHTRAGLAGAKLGGKVSGAKTTAKAKALEKIHLSTESGTNTPWSSTPEAKRQYYIKARNKFRAQGLNAHGEPFSMKGKRLENVRKAQQARRAREAIERAGRMKPFIYPNPEAPQAQTITAINFCPNCGEHLAHWQKKEN